MEFRQLRSFCSVAKLMSFHKAAEQLHYAQSSISAQIRALEEELNVQLFDRLGRRIVLTEAGKSLLHYAEKILDLADETASEIAGAKEPRGSLTVRVPESFGTYRLPPVIKRFRDRYPKVSLNLTTCTHEGLPADLRKGVTDLAFLMAEDFHSPDLDMEVLGFESAMLVAAPDHPLAGKPIVRTEDLAGESILLSKVDCSYRKSFERILNEKGGGFDTGLVFHCVSALKRCVMEGIGVTILPEIAVEADISLGRLSPLAWEEGRLEIAVMMIWYAERRLSPTLKAFMDTTREVLGGIDWGARSIQAG